MPKPLVHSWRDQCGSTVAQAAGVAIVAVMLVAALMAGARPLGPAINRTFDCVVMALAGGSACTGGDTTVPSGNAATSDGGSAGAGGGAGGDGQGGGTGGGTGGGQAGGRPGATTDDDTAFPPNDTSDTATGPLAPNRAAQAASFTADVLPVVGEIKGFIEIFTGTDIVTGEELGWWRFAGIAGIIGLNELKLLRYGDDVVDIARRGGKLDDVARQVAKGCAALPTNRAPGLAIPVFNVCDDLLKKGRQVKGNFPDTAGPSEVLYRKNPTTGKVSHYEVYDADGLPIKRVDLEGRPHGGVPTPHVLEYIRNIDPKSGKVYVNKPKTVRPAILDEIPTK